MQLPTGNPIDEQSAKKRSQKHAGGSQHAPRRQYRTDVLHLRVHSSREKNDTQCHHTDMLGHRHIVELYAQTVCAEQHAGQQEHQQGRDTETVTGLAHQDTTENQKGGYKQSYFNGNIHSYGSWNLIVQR